LNLMFSTWNSWLVFWGVSATHLDNYVSLAETDELWVPGSQRALISACSLVHKMCTYSSKLVCCINFALGKVMGLSRDHSGGFHVCPIARAYQFCDLRRLHTSTRISSIFGLHMAPDYFWGGSRAGGGLPVVVIQVVRIAKSIWGNAFKELRQDECNKVN